MTEWISLQERVERLEATIATLAPLFAQISERSRRTREGVLEISEKLDVLIAEERSRGERPHD